MLTEEFCHAAEKLLKIAARKRTTIMCAEAVFWRCHRRLVSDFMLVKRITVQHIMPSSDLRPHTLTDGARVETKELTYPPGADQAQL